MDRLDALRRDLRAFVDARDWDQFHAPRNLAAALAVEAGELLEIFQWGGPDAAALAGDDAARARVAEEAADVLLYALLLADKCGFDLAEAARRKLAANALKYPPEKARGSSAKYTDLG